MEVIIENYPILQDMSYCGLDGTTERYLMRDAMCNMTEQACWIASNLIWFFWVLHRPEAYYIYMDMLILVYTQ